MVYFTPPTQQTRKASLNMHAALPIDGIQPAGTFDARCFLWHANGDTAGMFILPPSAERYPLGIQIWEFSPWPTIYWQREGCANQYDARAQRKQTHEIATRIRTELPWIVWDFEPDPGGPTTLDLVSALVEKMIEEEGNGKAQAIEHFRRDMLATLESAEAKTAKLLKLVEAQDHLLNADLISSGLKEDL